MIPSLKKRLLWILVCLTLSLWAISALLLYVFSSRALEQQIDNQLQRYEHVVTYTGRVFARQIDEGLPLYEVWSDNPLEELRRSPLVVEGLDQPDLSVALNVWLEESLIAIVDGSPVFDKPRVEGFAYLETVPGGGRWRILTRYDEVSELWIRVGVEFESARWALLGTMGQALLPLLLMLPLTLLVLYLGVTRGLLPLNVLARQISQRNPGQLEPVATEGVPEEMAGVVASINRLMERLAFALEGEQRFTANAAHELMTPLAAIKAEVQLCQRQMDGGNNNGNNSSKNSGLMLTRIAQRVDRATHTVEQLLTLARLEPDMEISREPVALRALLTEVLADTAHLAAERGLQVNLEQGDELTVQGNAEALAILVRNLLVNAFRYASDGSAISIGLRGSDAVELVIWNDCAPLSDTEFQQIANRFYRVPGNEAPGAGLGLSIVQRVATLHGASFSAGPREGAAGFSARVVFPA